MTTVVAGLNGTHKNWWECDSGSRMTKIFDLSDPRNPRFIRDFGLPGPEPGSAGAAVPEGVHGPIALKNRVYFAYGTGARGMLQIADREKLLRGRAAAPNPVAPTRENLLFPEVGRLDMAPDWGGHTSFPVLGLRVPDLAGDLTGRVRDVGVLVSESLRNECQEVRQLTFLVDVTTESKPFSVATFRVRAASGDFCNRGGRFGPHSSNESSTPIYYGKLVFIAYFNAGVRAVDIYLVDRVNTGMHVVELTGPAGRGV